MERRAVLAFTLIILVVLGWSYLAERQRRAAPPVEPVPVESATAPSEPAAEPIDVQPPAAAVGGSAPEEIHVETDVFDVRLTSEGGRAVSWKLKQYTTAEGAPLELLPQYPSHDRLPLSIELEDAGLTQEFNRAIYRVVREPIEGGERISFLWSDGKGLDARKEMVFRSGAYLVDVRLDVKVGGRERTAALTFGPGFAAQDSVGKNSRMGTSYFAHQGVWNLAGRVGRRAARSIEPGQTVAGDLIWVGLEDQYFAALIVPGGAQARATWNTVEIGTKLPEVAVTVPGAGAQLYVGPKQFALLREQGHELEKVVWFSSYPLLAWFARMLLFALLWLHDHVVANYGAAIILATFLLRVALFPLNQYSMVSIKKTQIQTQRLQPKIKYIRSKYKKTKDIESRNRMNQELMELYKREGVNPMGGITGCLPMLVQFPILIGFYNMLTVAIELRGAPFFGWIQDLSTRDHLYVTPIVMGVAMFAQQWMAMGKVKDPAQQQQQRMMLIMPFMFTFLCTQMPSGMVLYWCVNNLLGIGQQWIVNRHTGRFEAATAEKAG